MITLTVMVIVVSLVLVLFLAILLCLLVLALGYLFRARPPLSLSSTPHGLFFLTLIEDIGFRPDIWFL